jgi:HK97 gp10 family phage protein
MSAVKFSVTGVKEIDQLMRTWPLDLSDKVLAQAHADAAFPLVAAAHLMAPVGKTGNLADSIGVVKVGIKRGGEVGQVAVGPRRSGGHKGFHAHFIEFGKTNRDGTRTSPQPFMAPAFEQTKAQVEAGIANAIGSRMLQTAKRILKNA